jgi:hypothetical protein
MESLLWARENAKESWARSQSYNLYGNINSIYLGWNLRYKARIFLKMAVVEDQGEEIKAAT